MNKAVIIKIAGLITVPLLVMIVAMYFLYPYINKEDYQGLVQAQEEKLDAEFEKLGFPPREGFIGCSFIRYRDGDGFSSG